MNLREIQRILYFTQRTIGDVRAAERGPNVLVKRVLRRIITRTIFKNLPF